MTDELILGDLTLSRDPCGCIFILVEVSENCRVICCEEHDPASDRDWDDGE